MLADARLSPDVLTAVFAALPAPPPAQIFLYGRLLEAWHPRMAEVTDLLQSLGYVAEDSFDPNIARSFRHAAPADAPET